MIRFEDIERTYIEGNMAYVALTVSPDVYQDLIAQLLPARATPFSIPIVVEWDLPRGSWHLVKGDKS